MIRYCTPPPSFACHQQTPSCGWLSVGIEGRPVLGAGRLCCLIGRSLVPLARDWANFPREKHWNLKQPIGMPQLHCGKVRGDTLVMTVSLIGPAVDVSESSSLLSWVQSATPTGPRMELCLHETPMYGSSSAAQKYVKIPLSDTRLDKL